MVGYFLAASLQELMNKPSLIYDVGFMHSGDSASFVVKSVFESEFSNFSTGFFGNKFNTLNDAWNNFVFNTGVLSFGVFSNSDQVAIFVSSWESFQTDAWSNVG